MIRSNLEPTVSVIIPTHNREELLKRSIISVLSQTFKPLEILVVDDYNSLATQKVVESFESHLVRYLSNSFGKGASSSRNYGGSVAKGDYIAFLDDDDEWLPTKLEKQLAMIQKEDLDACFSRIQIVYEGTNLSYSTNSKMVESPFLEILKENFIGGTISSVVKRELFLVLGGFDEKLPAREEYDLWIKILANQSRIGIVEEALAIGYRSLVGRSRISVSITNYERAIDLINSKYSSLVEKNLSLKDQQERISRQFEFLAAQAVAINLRGKAFYYYIKSFFISFKMKPLIGGLVSLVSPRLLIKMRARI